MLTAGAPSRQATASLQLAPTLPSPPALLPCCTREIQAHVVEPFWYISVWYREGIAACEFHWARQRLYCEVGRAASWRASFSCGLPPAGAIVAAAGSCKWRDTVGQSTNSSPAERRTFFFVYLQAMTAILHEMCTDEPMATVLEVRRADRPALSWGWLP